MSNIIIFIAYFLFTCAGMVLIKLGSKNPDSVLLNISFLDFKLSIVTLIGFILYAVSFFLYAVLLSRYELSFLNPATIGITSVLIFVSAAIFFGEAITTAKIIALLLIIIGVVIINVFK